MLIYGAKSITFVAFNKIDEALNIPNNADLPLPLAAFKNTYLDGNV